MARKPKKPAKKAPTFGPKSPEPRPFLGLGFLILGLLVGLAIWDYNPTQNPEFYSDIEQHNLIGIFGVEVASRSLLVLGLAAYATPILAFWVAYMFFRPYARKLGVRKLPPVLLIFLSLAVFGCLYQVETMEGVASGKVNLGDVADNMFPFGWGGWIGFWTYGQFLREFISMVGSVVVFGVLSAFSLIFLLFDNLGSDLKHLFRVQIGEWAKSRAEKAVARAQREKAGDSAR